MRVGILEETILHFIVENPRVNTQRRLKQMMVFERRGIGKRTEI